MWGCWDVFEVAQSEVRRSSQLCRESSHLTTSPHCRPLLQIQEEERTVEGSHPCQPPQQANRYRGKSSVFIGFCTDQSESEPESQYDRIWSSNLIIFSNISIFCHQKILKTKLNKTIKTIKLSGQVLEDHPGAETLSFSLPTSFLNAVVLGTLGVGLQHAVRAAPEQRKYRN